MMALHPLGSETVYDVAIIGAGIVGASCADEAAAADLRVVVIESRGIGGGATAAGMGHIVCMDDSEAQFALTHYSRELWRRLASELPPDVEFNPCGTLWIAADDEEMTEVLRKAAYFGARDVRTEVLDTTQLARLEPNLRPGLAGALLVCDDAVIYPPCAARFLLERACARGAAMAHGWVEHIDSRNPMVIKLSDGRSLRAAIVVYAGGAWTPELAPLLAEGFPMPVRKRKGHLVITDRYPGFVRHQLVELGYLKSAHSVSADSVAFNIQPRTNGQVLIGSSRQFGDEGSTVNPAILTRMLERAHEYMPGLANLTAIRVWTGFRAATPDKLPLIGPYPGDARRILATGHEGLGITTSLATGRLLVDQLIGRASAIPVEPYWPKRMDKEAAHAH